MAGCFLWSFLFASPKSDLCSECSFEDVCCIRGDFSYTDSLVEYSVVLLSLLWNVFRRGPQKCRMCAFDGFFLCGSLAFQSSMLNDLGWPCWKGTSQQWADVCHGGMCMV